MNKNSKNTINWKLVEVEANKLKPNPKNPKIRNEAGMKRLKKSIDKFGLVYDGICNADFSLLDGHSRLELNGKGKVKVFVPSRQLTAKEAAEMNAVFDLAKAGESDIFLMEETFDDEFFEEWGIEKPLNPNNLLDSFTLPSGDKAPFQQMTFTLANAQAERIKQALNDVEIKDGTDYGNENSNGNALHQIVLEWAEQKRLS